MLGSYPPRLENEGSDAYLDAIEGALLDHPREAAIDCVDPVHGIVRQCAFVPTVAEIHAWCERASADMHDVVRRDDARIAEARKTREMLGIEQQLSADERRAVVERFYAKLGPGWGLKRMDAVDIARGSTREEEEAAREARRKELDERTQAANERAMLAEYAARRIEPVRNKNGLVLPYGLVAQLNRALLVPARKDRWRDEMETADGAVADE